MEIGVTSQNSLKVDAVFLAYMRRDAVVYSFKTESGVAEQPVEEETIQGARNRIKCLEDYSFLDRIVSIENGIFREEGKWVDKAVVIVYDPERDKEFIAYSEGVVFLDEYVEIAEQRGFEECTVGQVMKELGVVEDAKDPHASLTGISRSDYLAKAVKDLVEKVESEGKKI